MKFSNILNWLSKPKNLCITMFIYTILSGLFVQMILLPYIFPSWQSISQEPGSAKGLLVKMDGQKFHRIALELSEAIEEKGWSQWELLPKGQLVSGIAAIFYVIIYPAPWSVLSVNALLNASACVCMYLILANLIENRQKSLIAALPFIFFPSNLLWNTQFHNENYAVPGVIFVLYGWTLITRKNENKVPIPLLEAFSAILFVALGSLLLGLVRVYILAGMSCLFIAVGVALGIHWLFSKIKMREYFVALLPVLLACTVMISTLSAIAQGFPSLLNDNDSTVTKSLRWEQTAWLPKIIEHQLRNLAKYRNKFIVEWKHGGSSIDLDIAFMNFGDMAAYIPRSVQIAFLSPFPSTWFSAGRNDSGTAMRIASAFEMIFVYFCLFGLPVFFWRNRKQPAVWAIIFICTAMLIVYAMVIPNIGSLYRFRYPYLMPLVCIGLAGWILAFENHPVFGKRKAP